MPFLSLCPYPKSYTYSLLPTSNTSDRSASNARHSSFTTPPLVGIFLSRRYARISIAIISALALFLFFSPLEAPLTFSTPSLLAGAYPPYPTPLDEPPTEDTRPPLYQRYTEYEKNLPQHAEELSFPEGKHAKFIYFANHNWGAGWGNAMQEMVLNAHLAYSSGRAFVFDNYTWDRDGPEYSDYNGKLIPARIPLSALVAGPMVGYPYSNPSVAAASPRAVSRHYYNQICPEPFVLSSEVVQATLPEGATALQVLEAWVEKLQSIEDRCVEIMKDTSPPFDIWILGSPRLHDILPSLFASPIVREFSWSPLIHSAFLENQQHFFSSTQQSKSFLAIPLPFLTSNKVVEHYSHGSPTPPHPSSLPLLALHLRRGDFQVHCDNLYSWGSTYTGYNTLPELPDRFFAEDPGARALMSEEDAKNAYREKCLVDIDKVRKRIVRAVHEWREKQLVIERSSIWSRSGAEERVKRKLRKVYIMTNGDRAWLQELKQALQADVARSVGRASEDQDARTDYDYDFVWSWDEISTSRDLDLGWEARYVAQAVDMYVGQRAELFIGNGFSSLTANIVMLRAANGVEPWKTRFW